MAEQLAKRKLTPYARSVHPVATESRSIQRLPLATSADTGGQLTCNETTFYPGYEPPAHTHTREDESFYILEGSLTFTVGAQSLSAAPGTFVWLPRTIQHGFTVDTDSARVLINIMPANLERYFEQMAQLFQNEHIVARPYPPTFYQKWQELSQQFGITLAPL
jgi:quercetin dioxygenase-like cupin family protein